MNLFDPESFAELVTNHYNLFVFVVFLLSSLITYHLIPKVLHIVKVLGIYKPVINRSAHTKATPALAGAAFFTTFMLMLSMLQSFNEQPTGNHLIAGLIIMFMVGLKDDLVVSSARIKLIGQLLATAFIIFSPELQITTLHGFLGIYEIPTYLGYLIAAFLVISLINAYNLIDGINGLAAIIGIVICSFYAFIFSQIGDIFFLAISITVVGILFAFLRFNLAPNKKRIFMGDSGSLTIGLILGFLSIKILGVSQYIPVLETEAAPTNRVLLILAVLFIPIFDTTRVMIVRLLDKRSPFEADANHIHHILLDLGLSHRRSSVILGSLNIVVAVLFIVLSNYLSTAWQFVFLVIIYAVTFLLFQKLDNVKSEEKS